MLDGILDRPGPDEAEVAVAWFDRRLGVQAGEAGAVDVELPLPEAVMAEPGVLWSISAPSTSR